MNPLTRRSFIAATLTAVPASLLVGPAAFAQSAEPCPEAEAEIASLRAQVAALSINTASGGGVNLLMMRHPKSGEHTVPMDSVFSFDRTHAFCRVDTNPRAFKMSTYELGEVTIKPNRFFMVMEATAIEEYVVATQADGSRSCRMRGMVGCSTEVGQANVTVGSRTAAEPAAYRIDAVDAGESGGAVGDSFVFTVYFDPVLAPVNHSIFGPEAVFTGELTSGQVTIVDPAHIA
jgi:hypothetical protein